MTLESFQIIIDKREEKSGIPKLLKAIGLNCIMKMLPIGDYIVSDETVIERKSIRDFVASISDGRLFDQCSRLKENFDNPVFIIEGNVDELEYIIESAVPFYGALSRLALEFKIPIVPTSDACHTAKLLTTMCSKKSSDKLYLKKVKKTTDLKKQQIATLCSLPGIGEKFAIQMLEKFETPLQVFAAKEAELGKIKGLGKTRAKKIKKILETKVSHKTKT